MELTIVSAAGLRGNKLNQIDPYCRVSFPGSKTTFETKPISDTKEPQWNETFSIPINEIKGGIINFTILDQNDVLKDTELAKGSLSFDINEAKDREIEKNIDLEFTHKNSGAKSTLQLKYLISSVKEEEVQEPEQELEKEVIPEEEDISEKISVDPIAESEGEPDSSSSPAEEEEEIKDEQAEEGKNEGDHLDDEENFRRMYEQKAAERNKKDEEITKKLEERIKLHHERYIAVQTGQALPAISSKNCRASPKPKQENEEPKDTQDNDDEEIDEEERQRQEELEERKNTAREEIEERDEEIREEAQRRYNAIISRHPKLTKNKEELEKKRKRIEADDSDDLHKMSREALENLYHELTMKDNALTKKIAELEGDIDEIDKQLEKARSE